MGMELIRGATADSLLIDAAFRDEWAKLWQKCPWSSEFQGPLFAVTWYRTYRERFEPLLIVSRDPAGRINGLLPLAMGNRSDGLVIAGGIQAEYQGWICIPELRNTFAWQAFQCLLTEIPGATLHFRYIPVGTPLSWTESAEVDDLTILKTCPRPILRFGNGDEIRASLSKSGNKSRLRRLKKIGPITFEHIQSTTEIGKLLVELIPFYDCRHLALHGCAPFGFDDFKKTFHIAMTTIPGLLHVTALRAGRHLVSAQLNIVHGKEVQLGLIAHNPAFAEHSPGKLHIRYLGKMLHEQGFEQLDLTPGGESYKDRFANAFDEVHTLRLFPTPVRKMVVGAALYFEAAAKRTLKSLNLTPTQVRSRASRFWRGGIAGALFKTIDRTASFVMSTTERRVYARPRPDSLYQTFSDSIHRNALHHLLAYYPSTRGPSRQEFISHSLRRIEEGQQFYSCVEDGRLKYIGWLTEFPTAEITNSLLPGLKCPANIAVISDMRLFSLTQSRTVHEASLMAIIGDPAIPIKIKNMYIVIKANDLDVLNAAVTTGFTYVGSVFHQTRLGRTRTRTVCALPMPETMSAGMVISYPTLIQRHCEAASKLTPATVAPLHAGARRHA